MLAGALALGLTACDGPKPADPRSTSAPGHSAVETPEQRLAAVTAEAERIEREYAAREAEETPVPPEWIYRRNERYRDYHLVQQRGAAIPGREFEAQIMCKNVFDAADYNMWALRNLVITGSRQGMTSFLGMVDGQQIEISLVMNEERRVPTFLIMGGTTIASCDPF